MSSATANDMGPQQTWTQDRQFCVSNARGRMRDSEPTAVTVSIHKTNGSEVRYLESENEYSFHNCPNRSCLPGMFAWLKAKYPILLLSIGNVLNGLISLPSKKRWMVPAKAPECQQPTLHELRGFVCDRARTENEPQYCCLFPGRQMGIMAADQQEGSAKYDKPTSGEYT